MPMRRDHNIQTSFEILDQLPPYDVHKSAPLFEIGGFFQPKIDLLCSSLIVSNVGDWTSRQIRTVPIKLWVRGVRASVVLRIVPLFRSVVLVSIGSGNGPCLPTIHAKRVPALIFWSMPNPEKTFRSEIIQAVKAVDPEAVILDTRKDGQPDVMAISYRLLKESKAEAVCVIANQKLTLKVVYAMDSRGISAFGAIWDS